MRIKGSGKIQSELQKSIYASYYHWIKTVKGYDVQLTGFEYVDIWEANLDKWANKGRKMGEYYMAVVDPSKPITAKNVAIIPRTEHANSLPKPPKSKEEQEAINETFQRKFKDANLQMKFEQAIQTPRSNYRSLNLLKQRAKRNTSVVKEKS